MTTQTIEERQQALQEELAQLQRTRAELEQRLVEAQDQGARARQELRERAFTALTDGSPVSDEVLQGIDDRLAEAERQAAHVRAALEQAGALIARVQGEIEEAQREAIRQQIRGLLIRHQELLEAGRVAEADNVGRQLHTLRNRHPELDAEVRAGLRGGE